jgi:hypothetical protein
MPIMIRAAGDNEPATLSAVARRTGDDMTVGLTAGHALRIFLAGDEVAYAADGEEARVGTCDPPPALGLGMDLGRFEAVVEHVLDLPLGFARTPRLLPEIDLDRLRGEELIFLGGQVGRRTGTLVSVGSENGHAKTLSVRLAVPRLITGDSGGPLYFDDGETLFLVATLVGGAPSDPGFSDATFFHPGRALDVLNVALDG